MYKVVTYTAQELFEKVWQTPVLTRAQEVGVSDVAFAKACRKAGIPMPGRGYWAKSESQRPAKPEAPSGDNVISFRVLDPAYLPAQPEPAANERVIPVPEELIAPHRLVSQWLAAAKSAKTQGDYINPSKKVLDVQTSPECKARCATLLDTLIKASEAEGHTWRISRTGLTLITIKGEDIAVKLWERLNRLTIPPPPPPKRRPGAAWEPNFTGPGFQKPQYEWTSTGTLTFQIDARMDKGLRRNWKDSQAKRLEDKLPEILDNLVIAAASAKVVREEDEARRQKWAEEDRERTQTAREDEIQRRLRQSLVTHTEQWERTERLRRFIKAVELRQEAMPSPDQAKAWLAWAREQANRLDPLQQELGEVTELAVELESWFSESSFGRKEKDWRGEAPFEDIYPQALHRSKAKPKAVHTHTSTTFKRCLPN